MRGAVGLGDPEVRAGARGFVRLVGIVPVLAATYGPIIAAQLRNLAGAAASEIPGG